MTTIDGDECEYCESTQWTVSATLIECYGCGVLYGRVNDFWVVDISTLPQVAGDTDGK